MYDAAVHLGQQCLSKPTKKLLAISSRIHMVLHVVLHRQHPFVIHVKSSHPFGLSDLMAKAKVVTCEKHLTSKVGFQALLSNANYRKRR